jgi:hypothetical protein
VATKRPVIRPGQSKPYIKATRREIEQRLKAAALFESLEWEKPDIEWFFQEVFGIEWRQTDRYVAHARARHA